MPDSYAQFSADLEPFFSEMDDSQVERVRDVLICATDPNLELSSTDPWPIDAPIFGREGSVNAGPVQLGRGLRVERLEKELAELVMNACSPRGHYFHPHRQFGERYSYVRDVAPSAWEGSAGYAWDPDHVLWDALTLSRLVQDNAHSTRYAARVVDYAGGKQTVVYTLFPEAKYVYRVRRDRDWLDPDQGAELASLLAGYWQAENEEIPKRVGRATWRAEYASWQRTGDTIVPVLVSGLEALLKVGKERLTRQFASRGCALAHELGLDTVTPEFMAEMYDARSDWVHGARVRLFAAREVKTPAAPATELEWDVFGKVGLVQTILRRAVRRCYEDPGFRAVFTDDAAIDSRWPLT